ncbi:DUF1810 domain-containing protein [Aliiroseovarius sp. KMU-50]|uniref:DUF1810 domain-containing protein n=1 Tax=Aliiroseovarius salicola TaxID=3009082 RepID=A0ABT4VXJ7_9RHOB|nr:DUF1810 domain-containing protein [Aliiroseovarius sp. KMU-50]MDA5092964.1 DUF1810 domain-containing protein [Aliiroseovarius sp. KMU-50]
MDDELDMFIEAQDTVWSDVLSELQAGKKTSHWMWFVFPQLAELGQSDMSQLYGLEDLDEATAYLEHEELKRRLLVVTSLMLEHVGTEPADILGRIDAMKLHSSMTLFAAVPDAHDAFREVLEAFYGGKPCTRTIEALART